jgi:hypothetical protein
MTHSTNLAIANPAPTPGGIHYTKARRTMKLLILSLAALTACGQAFPQQASIAGHATTQRAQTDTVQYRVAAHGGDSISVQPYTHGHARGALITLPRDSFPRLTEREMAGGALILKRCHHPTSHGTLSFCRNRRAMSAAQAVQ